MKPNFHIRGSQTKDALLRTLEDEWNSEYEVPPDEPIRLVRNKAGIPVPKGSAYVFSEDPEFVWSPLWAGYKKKGSSVNHYSDNTDDAEWLTDFTWPPDHDVKASKHSTPLSEQELADAFDNQFKLESNDTESWVKCWKVEPPPLEVAGLFKPPFRANPNSKYSVVDSTKPVSREVSHDATPRCDYFYPNQWRDDPSILRKARLYSEWFKKNVPQYISPEGVAAVLNKAWSLLPAPPAHKTLTPVPEEVRLFFKPPFFVDPKNNLSVLDSSEIPKEVAYNSGPRWGETFTYEWRIENNLHGKIRMYCDWFEKNIPEHSSAEVIAEILNKAWAQVPEKSLPKKHEEFAEGIETEESASPPRRVLVDVPIF